MDKKHLAHKIRELRRSTDLTQSQLGTRAGVAQRVIHDIENERGNPTIETLNALAMALNVSVTALIDGPECDHPAPAKPLKTPPDLTAAAQFLLSYAMASPERRRAVCAILFDDEAYLALAPADAHALAALLKAKM